MLEVLSFAMLLVVGPYFQADDLDSSFKSLQEAQTKKDTALIKKTALETYALAQKLVAVPEPAGADEKTTWKESVAYARDIALQTDYIVLSVALAGPHAVTVDLMGLLEQQSPKSHYMDEGYTVYLYALSQTGASAKIPAIAEKGLANFPNNEDLLIYMADYALSHKQSDRALGYARRVITVMEKHPKPEGMAAADWEHKKTTALTRGYWIAGVICGEKNIYVEANRNLRAALPLIKGNDAMLGPALFYLGVVNFQLGQQTLNKAQVLEAATFSEQAAKYPGAYADQAWKNATLIKTAAQRMR